MARLAAWVAIAAVAAVVVGCGPAKELPDDVIKHVEPGEKPVAVPAASEPKAKEYVEKATKAFAAGKPELVAKGKVSRLTLKGKQFRRDVGPVEVARTIGAVWPGRLVDTDTFQLQGRGVVLSAYLQRPQFTVVENGVENESLPGRAEMERNFAADNTAQHWMALLLPPTDPKAVVFEFQSSSVTSPQTGQPQSLQLVKLALPDFPLFQLAFDPKTDLLVRVEYSTTEQGVRRKKQWSALEHKPGPDGQMLPSKTEVRYDGQVVEQWEVEKWEFPATIPDAEFSPPKK